MTFELDEFVSGELFHCDSLVHNGKCLFVKVSKYNVPCAEFLSGKPIGSITLLADDPESLLIKALNDKILIALSPLPNGAFHLEVFKKESGELVFLEIAARTPGAYVPQSFLNGFGVNIEEAHLKLQMGIDARNTCKVSNNGNSAWIWYPIKKGIVTNIVHPKLDSPFEIDWHIGVGSSMEDPKDLGGFAVRIILWNECYETLKQDFNFLSSFCPFYVTCAPEPQKCPQNRTFFNLYQH